MQWFEVPTTVISLGEDARLALRHLTLVHHALTNDNAADPAANVDLPSGGRTPQDAGDRVRTIAPLALAVDLHAHLHQRYDVFAVSYAPRSVSASFGADSLLSGDVTEACQFTPLIRYLRESPPPPAPVGELSTRAAVQKIGSDASPDGPAAPPAGAPPPPKIYSLSTPKILAEEVLSTEHYVVDEPSAQ